MPELNIRKVKRTTKTIIVSYLNGDEEHLVVSRDNPRPEFMAALDALNPLVTFLCVLPDEYGDGTTVTGIRFTKRGNKDAVMLLAKKTIEGNTRPFNIVTPSILLDEPEKGGAAHLTVEHAILVERVVEEAKRYVQGQRAQGQIKLDAGGEEAESEAEKE